jgi:hypothetical protein
MAGAAIMATMQAIIHLRTFFFIVFSQREHDAILPGLA